MTFSSCQIGVRAAATGQTAVPIHAKHGELPSNDAEAGAMIALDKDMSLYAQLAARRCGNWRRAGRSGVASDVGGSRESEFDC
jgi:hypothetical protein